MHMWIIYLDTVALLVSILLLFSFPDWEQFVYQFTNSMYYFIYLFITILKHSFT